MNSGLPPKRRLAMLARLLRGIVNSPNPLATVTEPRLCRENLPGLRGRIEVVRDAHGVPHVYADHERDLFSALGFLQGADRFTYIDMIRHLGAGRFCEYFGNLQAPRGLDMIGGKKVADVDAFVRPLGFEHDSIAAYRRLDERGRACLDGFAEGVNAALAAMRGAYPVEYLLFGAVRPWMPWDCLLAARSCAFVVTLTGIEHELAVDGVRGAVGDDLAKLLYPDAPWHDVPVSYRPTPGPTPHLGIEPPPGSGSNNWAVGSSRSAAGAPLVANDPHVPMIPLPTFWYHVHLRGPRFDVQGGMFPGFPGFGFGHNGALAWGCTTGFRDGWDVYRVHRLADDRTRYRTVTGVGAITPHRETLYARAGRSVTHEWESCEHGILYPGWKHHDGVDLAVRFVGADSAVYFEGCLAVMEEKSVDGHRAAVAKLHEGPFDFNHTYAHADGHFGWEIYGRQPRRPKDGLFVRDAHDPDAQWIGYVPFDEMPKILNPARGYVATANSYTDENNFEIVATKSHFEPRFRQDRIERRLAATMQHDQASFAAIQMEVYAENAPRLRDILLDLVRPLESAPGATGEAYRVLRDWDGEFGADSGAAAIYYFTIAHLTEAVFAPLFDRETGLRFVHGRHARPRLFALLLDPDDGLRAVVEQRGGRPLSRAVGESFERAVADVVAACGDSPLQWRWGRIQRARLTTALGVLPGVGRYFVAMDEELPGYPYTVNPYVSVPLGKQLVGFVGPTSRFICDLARPREAWFSHTSGPSGDAFSALFRNLSRPWLRGEQFLSALWEPEEVPQPLERVVIG